jgi:hypothetical protein
MGLSAYAATAIAAPFAYQGVRGSRAARYKAWTSRLIRRAHARSRSLMERSVSVQPIVQGRHQEQCQQRRRDRPTNDDRR